MPDVRALISELAKLPEGPPIVTLYLDARWRDEQQRDRVRLFFREKDREARALFNGDDLDARSIRQTLDRLERYVDDLVNQSIHPAARGVLVIASEARHLFTEVLIGEEFEQAMFIDRKPRLSPLIEAYVLEKPAYYVSVDSHGATIIEVLAGRIIDEQALERDVPQRHKMGGWSQRTFQQHVKELIRMVWQECAKVLEQVQREDGPGPIVLFGQEPNVRNFLKELPVWMQEKVVAMRPAPPDRNGILRLGREAVDEDRVSREFATIHHILRQGLADRSGTVGLEDTLLAMNERRVRVLALTQRFEARGYQCANCDALWATGSTGCVFCGGKTSLVNLREELVRRCLAQGADVITTPEASPLNAYRGIGALLRHLSGEEHQKAVLGYAPAESPELAHSITS